MKVNIEIECTPQEARAFMGLPDLSSLHKLYLDRMEQLVKDGISSADVEKMMKQWMPMMSESWEQWQKMMWASTLGANKS